jgi:hypothetical protein
MPEFSIEPHPDRTRTTGGVVIARWVLCFLCTVQRGFLSVHKNTARCRTGAVRTSENSVHAKFSIAPPRCAKALLAAPSLAAANFRELWLDELPRILLKRTSENAHSTHSGE